MISALVVATTPVRSATLSRPEEQSAHRVLYIGTLSSQKWLIFRFSGNTFYKAKKLPILPTRATSYTFRPGTVPAVSWPTRLHAPTLPRGIE